MSARKKRKREGFNLTVLSPDAYEEMLKKKKAIVVRYAFRDSDYGRCLVAVTDGKLCHFSFANAPDEEKLAGLRREWPRASFANDPAIGERFAVDIFREGAHVEGIARGTPFQEDVWRALLTIERGETRHYEDVAAMIGRPKATRAVASAVARNPISYLVPCHRVVSKNGDAYKYSGGRLTKKKLLAAEGYRE